VLVGRGVCVGAAVGAAVCVGFGVAAGGLVGVGVRAAVGAGVPVGAAVGWSGPGVPPPGGTLGTSVGATVAGGTLGFTAVIVLDGLGTPEAVRDGASDAGAEADTGGDDEATFGLVGEGDGPGDWPTAVFPLG
jgi:hypothetical protein